MLKDIKRYLKIFQNIQRYLRNTVQTTEKAEQHKNG